MKSGLSFKCCIAIVAILAVSCYHIGARRTAVIVDTVFNKTNEPGLEILLRNSLTEQFGTRITATSRKNVPESNTYRLNANIVSCSSDRLARAELRDKRTRDDRDKAYQGVLYKIELKIEYSITSKDGKEIQNGVVTGLASMPRMHDREVGLKNANAQAANDAARKIAEIITDINLD